MTFENGIGWTQQAGNEIWIKDCFRSPELTKMLRYEFENVFYMATDHKIIVSNPKKFKEHQYTIVNEICEELESRINCEKSGICPDCKNIIEACYCD